MDYGLVMCVSLLSLVFYCYIWILPKIPFLCWQILISPHLGPRRFKLRPDRFHQELVVETWQNGGYRWVHLGQSKRSICRNIPLPGSFFLFAAQKRGNQVPQPSLVGSFSLSTPNICYLYKWNLPKNWHRCGKPSPFVDHIPRDTIGFAHLCQFTLGCIYNLFKIKKKKINMSLSHQEPITHSIPLQ